MHRFATIGLWLRIAGLYALYLVARGLTAVFESRPVRTLWAAMFVPAVVSLVMIASLTRSLENEVGPFDGRQVPMVFEVEPVVGEITSAHLILDAAVQLRAGEVRSSEAIWVEGYVSGRPEAQLVRPSFVREDLSATNTLFADALEVCCRQRPGRLRIELHRLLFGSNATVTALLADGRLDVVVANDTQIDYAALVVCQRVDGETLCQRTEITPRQPRT